MCPFYQISIDQKLGLILDRVEKYSHAIVVINTPVEDAHKIFKWARANPDSVSKLEFFAESNESIFVNPFLDQVNDTVLNRNRFTVEAEHILHPSRVIDVMKKPVSVKVREYITRKQGLAYIMAAETCCLFFFNFWRESLNLPSYEVGTGSIFLFRLGTNYVPM